MKIKPCPYCKSDEIAVIRYPYGIENWRVHKLQAKCMVCQSRGPAERTESEAIAAWDEVSDLRTRVEELEKIIFDAAVASETVDHNDGTKDLRKEAERIDPYMWKTR